jgi:GDP/UDP-N,N'-diacetylbacillosamine 2-epimerase (hydrolysing)
MGRAAVKRRVAVITGTRAEFGLLTPILRAMRAEKRLDPRLIATGMHLLPKFGRTLNDIRRAGWAIDAIVPMQTGRDAAGEEPIALARGIAGIARALDRLRADAVLVLGDRIEAFAGACAAAAGRRFVIHVHGGDRALGDLDDSLRNAITRLAHLHLVASRDAANRLKRMGEATWRIKLIGAPGLDDIPDTLAGRRAMGSPGAKVRAANGSAPPGPYAVIVQHPCGKGAAHDGRVMRSILSAVVASGLTGVILHPNSDPGHDGILGAIQASSADPRFRSVPSLPRPEYLQFVAGAAVLVGNSSSGIIESASLGVNAVNIGPRQQGRLKCGPGVIDCGESAAQIQCALRKALQLPRPRPRRSVYGNGTAGERAAQILASLVISPRWLRRTLTY